MTVAPRHTGASLVRVVPPRERLDRDGEAVVLVGTSVVRLSALAVLVLDTCSSAETTVDDLTTVLVGRFGLPGDGAGGDVAAATREVLRALAGEGLVELLDVDAGTT